MSARICPSCGDPLPLQTGKGGRRRYCEGCSPSRRRGPAMAPARATVATLPPAGGKEPTGVLEAVLREVRAAGVAAHWAAAVAVVLAKRIDSDQEPGAALASLVKALREILPIALSSAASTAEPDPLEQIRLRAEARIRAVPDPED